MSPTPLPRFELTDDIGRLEQIASAWDALAVAAEQPLGAPGWKLAWWASFRPAGAQIRAALAWIGDELIGVAPFVATRRRGLVEYRLMASGMAIRNGPALAVGREREALALIARALASARPRPHRIVLTQVDIEATWPTILRAAWPGALRPVLDRGATSAVPVLIPGGKTSEEWFARRSSSFRAAMRRDRRQIEGRGGRFERATTDERLTWAMQELRRLHVLRWGERSPLASPEGAQMMADAGVALGPDRFRVYLIIGDDERAVGVQIFIVSGAEVVYWNGGWDPDWKAHSPSLVGILDGVSDAIDRGAARIDFGEDDTYRYKRRFADEDAPVRTVTLWPRDVAYPAALVFSGPERLRRLASAGMHRMPDTTQARLRRLIRRGAAPESEPQP